MELRYVTCFNRYQTPDIHQTHPLELPPAFCVPVFSQEHLNLIVAVKLYFYIFLFPPNLEKRKLWHTLNFSSSEENCVSQAGRDWGTSTVFNLSSLLNMQQRKPTCFTALTEAFHINCAGTLSSTWAGVVAVTSTEFSTHLLGNFCFTKPQVNHMNLP